MKRFRRALLEALEDLEDVRIAEQRLANPGRRWTQEDLEQELDLENGMTALAVSYVASAMEPKEGSSALRANAYLLSTTLATSDRP